MALRLQPASIQGELARFVLVLALPLVLLVAYALYSRSQHDLADAEAAVHRLAQGEAEHAARFVEDTRRALEAIARRPLVRAMDASRCDPGLADLLALYPRAGNFLVVNREARILCGAIPPPRGRDARMQDEALLAGVLETGRFALSRPNVGRINKRWALAAVHPVRGAGGGVIGAVSMSIDLMSWHPLQAEAGLPKGTIAVLVSDGVVIARTEDAASWIGRDLADAEIMRRVRARPEGIVHAQDAADVARIWGFRPVPGTDWVVLAGMPAEAVYGPLRERIARGVLLAALVIAGALALALLYARRLARPIRDIALAVRRREPRIPVAGPREVAEVAAELNRGIEQGERLQIQLERMPIACVLFDAELRITDANPAAERTFGWSAAEMRGRRAGDLYVPPERRETVDAVFERLRRGEFVSAAGESLRKDGTRVALEWVNTPLLGAGGGFLGLMSMATDITEREAAKRRLERSQRLFAALSEVNEALVRVRERDPLFERVCAICVARLQFRVAAVSLVDPARRAIVPQVCAGPAAAVLRELVFPLEPDAPLAATVTATAVRTRAPAVANDVETDAARAAARPVRARIGSRSTASFPLLQAGAVIGAFTLHSDEPGFFDADVVELLTRMAEDVSFALDKLAEHAELEALTRDLETRVERRTAELAAANQELEAFSYSVSHDLRAPVRHIDGFARLLAKELPAAGGGKAAHYLGTITAASKRMGALIDDLLQLSRTGRLPLRLERVELAPLVREVMHDAQPEVGARRVEWAVGRLPAVLADPALLKVVLHNLVSNALKYTRPRPVARIAVEARAAPGGLAEITVRDNGVGFDARFKDKLFGVFQRLHRDEEFEGTGIGLATARRIVHRHGQRIWGEGETGAGAAFTFTLAQCDEEEAMHEGGADIAVRG